MENKTLASVVKSAREKLGISQRELSRRTGIDNNTLAKIEKGERKKPNVLSLRKISFLLNLDLEELLKLAGYNEQDIEVSLNQNSFIISSGNAPLIALEDLINNDKSELLARNILREIGTKIDYNQIEFINNLDLKKRDYAIKSFKKFLKDNNSEIKNLKEHIKRTTKMLNNKTD